MRFKGFIVMGIALLISGLLKCGTGFDLLGEEWLDGWTYRIRLTFDNPGQAEELTDFPLMVRLNTSRISYDRTQDAGHDLRFTDSDGKSLLAFEIEDFNEADDDILWVRIPQIPTSGRKVVYLYYGNASASSASDSASVWGSSFQAVYHLNGAFADSTAHFAAGSNNGTTAGTGKLSGGRTATDPQHVDLGSNLDFAKNINHLTLSAWVKPSSFIGGDDHSILSLSQTGASTTFRAGLFIRESGGTGGLRTRARSQGDGSDIVHLQDTNSISTGSWVWVASVISYGNNLIRHFINGTEVSSTQTGSFGATATENGAAAAALLGRNLDGGDTDGFEGDIDEVRIEAVQRSAAWMLAQFKSMNDSALTFSGEERR